MPISSGHWPEIRAAKDGLIHRSAGYIYSVNGTMAPDPFITTWPSFPGMLLEALNEVAPGMWDAWPIGYPAQVYPMRPSIQAAIYREEGGGLVNQMLRHPVGVPKVLVGYSQGGNVVNLVWRDEILAEDGRLHQYKDDIVAIILWGDPMRCPGRANGNLLAGKPVPGKEDGYTTGGIAGPDCLTPEQTPDFLFSRANPGDLYSSCPVGDDPWHHETEVGYDERLVYEAVMEFDGHDLYHFAKEVFEIFFMPWSNLWPLFQAIWNGLTFAASAAAPHGAYEIDWAVEHLVDLGSQLRS